MTVAAAAHAVKSYGNRVGKGEANKCFLLSPKQKAGVKEMLANKIDGDIRLADLAGQSNMPGLQLMRSYQETTVSASMTGQRRSASSGPRIFCFGRRMGLRDSPRSRLQASTNS